MPDLKVFVWASERTLKGYRAGMVVVAAADEDAAWERLKAKDYHIWYWLQTGIRYVFSPQEAAVVDPEDYEEGFPERPVAYSLADLPVLFVVGGD